MAELNRRANQLAHYLRSRELDQKWLVGLCVERSVELVVGLLGMLKAGGAYLPLDPDIRRSGWLTCWRMPQVQLVLTQERVCAELAAGSATVGVG